jgi:hypothetical protein
MQRNKTTLLVAIIKMEPVFILGICWGGNSPLKSSNFPKIFLTGFKCLPVSMRFPLQELLFPPVPREVE